MCSIKRLSLYWKMKLYERDDDYEDKNSHIEKVVKPYMSIALDLDINNLAVHGPELALYLFMGDFIVRYNL